METRFKIGDVVKGKAAGTLVRVTDITDSVHFSGVVIYAKSGRRAGEFRVFWSNYMFKLASKVEQVLYG